MTNYTRFIFVLLGLISTSIAACNCGSGLSCCNGQCYNPSVYSCPTDPVSGNSILCTKGSGACNGGCYNPSVYSCKNGVLAQGASSGTTANNNNNNPSTTTGSSNTNTCQSMFASLKCRTASEDPSKVDANAVAGARSWLCGNFGQYCSAISTGGQYASCNSVEQISYAMNLYYSAFSFQGSSACNFGGIAQLVSGSSGASSGSTGSSTPTTSGSTTTACQSMFASLSCRTSSENPSQVDSGSVTSTRSWLCTNYPQYCTAINSGGQYSSCNAVEQISYAMSQYYNAFKSQGSSACNFGGLGKLVASTGNSANPSTTTGNSGASTGNSGTGSTSTSTTCQNMYSALTCRTTNEDPSKLDANAMAGARSWLCANYAQYCTAINSGGQYSGCNAAEQLSYAMNLYYNAFSSQGSSACNFGGVAQLVGGSSSSNPVNNNPTPSPSNNNFPTQTADLRIINSCKSTLWFEARYGNQGAPLPGQSVTATQALPGSYVDYTVPDTGLSGSRFWAKFGCDSNGKNCQIGDQMQYWPNPPGGCPSGGCTPPVDSLFEATWGCRPGTSCNSANPTTWFDTSQVDGWTIPYKLTPVGDTSGCDCIGSSCGFKGVDASTLDVSKCPSGENLSDNGAFPNVNVNGNTVGLSSVDLRIINNGNILGCMSPCKRLNWGTPYGLQQAENSGSAMWMCCPTPTPDNCTPGNGCITPNACRAGPIINTQYVAAVHSMAPGVYSYSYDDGVGLHACPAGVTKYTMEFCPSGSAAYPGKA